MRESWIEQQCDLASSCKGLLWKFCGGHNSGEVVEGPGLKQGDEFKRFLNQSREERQELETRAVEGEGRRILHLLWRGPQDNWWVFPGSSSPPHNTLSFRFLVPLIFSFLFSVLTPIGYWHVKTILKTDLLIHVLKKKSFEEVVNTADSSHWKIYSLKNASGILIGIVVTLILPPVVWSFQQY